ncbi:MAG: flagellar motor stator protein MotA [Chthoniobacterales bacterium]|nr:flagellar motor stator protein MotA [Chthoniobacterales bacterium]
MVLLLGYLIVFGSAMGGFMLAGGNPIVLLHISEIVTICGIGTGILVIASPPSVLATLVHQVQVALKGSPVSKDEFIDLLKLLYELFSKARRGGLVAIEEDILDPSNSPILSKYPSFVNDSGKVEFLRNSLRPVIDGRVRPEHLLGLLENELETVHESENQPVHVLQLVGDSLPGVGIVAAVMGIINTMGSVADGPEKVGLKVAAALTGTFLGVFLAYGFVNPLAARLKSNNMLHASYYIMIMKACVSFVNGMAPIMAVEVARRCIQPDLQPTADELEEMLKSTGSSK